MDDADRTAIRPAADVLEFTNVLEFTDLVEFIDALESVHRLRRAQTPLPRRNGRAVLGF